jgi:tRNA uridine 5-carbamoylmethylation protein Kti12
MSRLILVRGIPGSGKSTIARQLDDAMEDSLHIEADMYFMKDGVYQFDATKLHAAHTWCQNMTDTALARGNSVIVSNTFTTVKELRPYFDIAKKFGIVPTVIVAQNQFQNEHNVPEETLKRMRDRFQYDIQELFNE